VTLPTSSVSHIGVAVEDLSAAIPFYRDILGATPQALDDADGAAIVALTFGDIDIELLEPTSPEGPVAKFLAKRGPGIHHICFKVSSLDEALDRCRDMGYRLVEDQPRIGAHGRRIAFLHPRATSGILLELTE
jgi:methylmalonyl-CoA/ethylmalonyl-CoA epimerase